MISQPPYLQFSGTICVPPYLQFSGTHIVFMKVLLSHDIHILNGITIYMYITKLRMELLMSSRKYFLMFWIQAPCKLYVTSSRELLFHIFVFGWSILNDSYFVLFTYSLTLMVLEIRFLGWTTRTSIFKSWPHSRKQSVCFEKTRPITFVLVWSTICLSAAASICSSTAPTVSLIPTRLS